MGERYAERERGKEREIERKKLYAYPVLGCSSHIDHTTSIYMHAKGRSNVSTIKAMKDMNIFSCVIFYSIILAIVSPQPTTITIGALLDSTTRDGKEAKVAIEMAIDNFKTNMINQTLVLYIRNSEGTPAQTAIAARDLINSQQIKALFGPHAWEESSIVAELGSKANIPTLSLADSTPPWAIEQWPFLLQASPSQNAQMKVVASIVDSWGWRCLSIVYEDTDSTSSEVMIPHLLHALQGLDSKISNIIALPPFSSSSSLSLALKRLKRDQCRVFVVHTSFPMAIRLFQAANKMEMMEKDYVWITTNTFTDFVHSIDVSTISTILQGVVGVRSYFPKNGRQVQDFRNRFRTKFRADHPEEDHLEPGIFAVQAYDATRVVAEALIKTNNLDGQELLQKISMVNLNGLIGEVRFKKRKLAPSHIFQIVNVAGRSYRELGFWSEGKGFSETINHDKASYSSSMEILGQVVWPGEPLYTPRGWNLPTIANPIKVGVPSQSPFKQYVTVTSNHWDNSYSYSGFSIEVFRETLRRLPYYLPYKFFPFNGTYDALVEQVYLKNFDAVAGDVSIVAKRYKHAEFTHPYTEIGVVMVVPVQPQLLDNTWFFLKPFTKSMWAIMLAIAFYNGFVVWVIEPDLVGDSVLDIIGTPIWLGFSTLFGGNGGRLRSNMSRIASVVWLFVALIIIQSYTASLTSILTVQRLQPGVTSIDQLKKSNAMIGYDKGSFLASYLVDVLGFKPNSLEEMASPEAYVEALKSGEIGAAFLDAAPSKLFLAKYGKMFTVAGPTYRVGGFGFAFPIGSPILCDITEALLNVSESGTLQGLENNMTGSDKKMEMESGSSENVSLSLHSFWVLFVLTGGTSTVFLAISMISKFFKSSTDRARIAEPSYFNSIVL